MLWPYCAFALADDGADDRVEPGTVAAAGQDADPHGSLLVRSSVAYEFGRLAYPASRFEPAGPETMPKLGRKQVSSTTGPDRVRADPFAGTADRAPSAPAGSARIETDEHCDRLDAGPGCRETAAGTASVAARHRDFVVLTDRRLLLWSCGFFTRRPRRRVFDEALATTSRSTTSAQHPAARSARARFGAASRYGSSSAERRGCTLERSCATSRSRRRHREEDRCPS